MIENARNNFGLGVRTFYDTNTGTKKSPKIYTTIEVDILDLIKYYGGIKNIPEVIVNEIISSKFWNLQVLIDKEGKILARYLRVEKVKEAIQKARGGK